MSVHYGWPYYWSMEPVPIPMPPATFEAQRVEGDPHLRSLREVSSYHVFCGDENVGSVDDFVADDGSWWIRWLVVALRGGWWLPKRVLVGSRWIASVSWPDKTVRVKLGRHQVEKSPEFDPAAGVNREYEVRLYDYYGRPIDSEELPWPPRWAEGVRSRPRDQAVVGGCESSIETGIVPIANMDLSRKGAPGAEIAA